MHIKSIILEGFKSYGQRTEVNGFDKEFNAITGLNGSGKSNILDAICFVLGISNLGHVRAGSLQDLVYKSGQAGITKASVTIKFDNQDTANSPLGYEQYEEITVTRQTVVGGKNKYLINGSNVTNKRVIDMFCSVQLNVNNPHFLIMQGRITKVLNMKPPEILSMIEEAAGTRMYEGKRQAACKTIEKKDSKLRELEELIQQEISPKLQKLKDERVQYLEYQKVQREVEHLTHTYVAWKYFCAQDTSQKAKENLESVQNKIKERKNNISSGENEIKDLAARVEEINVKMSGDIGDELRTLENQLVGREKTEAKLNAKIKNHKETVASEQKRKKQLEKSAKEDEGVLAQKEAEMSNRGGAFSTLKEAEAADAEALAAAQRKYQAVSAGLLSNDDGEASTLQEQLMDAKQSITTANTEIKQSQMELAHNRTELASKEKELSSSSKGYSQDAATLDRMEKEVSAMAAEMSRLQYEDGSLEMLEEQQHELNNDIRALQQQVGSMEAKYPTLSFKYKDPHPNFDRSKVKGLVCRMFRVKDPKFTRALECAGGGRLYNVVADNEETSKQILQNGQLQRRVTVIPLNRITGRSMDARTISHAKQLGGQNKVFAALDLIEFEPELRPAMEWVFGQVFICTDSEAARTVTFNPQILKRCVTIEGDVFDPSGTLTGGAAVRTEPVLSVLIQLRESQDLLSVKEQEYKDVVTKIRETSKTAERFKTLQQKHNLRSHETQLLRDRLQQTDHHQLTVDIKNLKQSINDLTARVEQCKGTIKEGEKKVKVIEEKIKDAKKIREQELKAAEQEMNRLKKKAEESRGKWKKREQEFDTMNLEIQELQAGLEATHKQIKEVEELLVSLEKEGEELNQEAEQVRSSVAEMQAEVKMKKEEIAIQNREIQTAEKRRDQLQKLKNKWELEIKQLEIDCQKIKSDSSANERLMEDLTNKYDWIERDKQFFGNRGGVYDFEEHDPKEIGKRLSKLEEVKEKLGRTVNARAMNLLSKEEEMYADVMKKKGIVEHDRNQIMEVIRELDLKKKQALKIAWKQVNKDFGSIFSTLLPGATAKLEPPPGLTVLDGLEVKVCFGDIWKESLNELSGGQRSLVALSLILAMLLFKPAPIYILDEVDAALDLSHTQNIGTMLKKHFTHSQFVVVSLKDGMFNNANVLFRTKFVDGMSTVSRTVQYHAGDTNVQQSKKSKK